MSSGPQGVAIIVQARMGATRLPGKPLKEVLGRPLLFYLIERLKRCQHADVLCIATTDRPQDDAIANLAQAEEVSVIRGSEEDVLSRYLQAAETLKCDLVVRVTADCPLLDPALIDQLILAFKPPIDYLSNTLQRTYPRGMDIEVFSRQALEKTAKEAKALPEREHVTLYIYRHPELFHLENVADTADHSHHRWTVDTEEDFELIKRMIEALYPTHPSFTYQDLLQLIAQHPDWAALNQHIKQKSV